MPGEFRGHGHAITGGHFFPEEHRAETAADLATFFARLVGKRFNRRP
jgi:surfactin synthase thioesterase subunit